MISPWAQKLGKVMTNSIFDSHTHYDDKAFDEDRHAVLEGLPKAGVCGLINCGSDIQSSRKSVELAKKYDFVYAACGIHPHSADAEGSQNFIKDELPLLFEYEKCLALGEIGLDYHYDFSPREIQKEVFIKQIELALDLGKPIIVHNREAHGDSLEILKKYKPNGVLHSFSGSLEMAAEIIKMGMYISLSGVVTFKNARKPLEVARFVPIERLLLDTDCPYLAPVPFRGKRSDSSMILYTAQKIAEERNMEREDLLEATAKNAKELFGID